MASPYGDGSDGAVNLSSGQTLNLALNTKYQFTSVNIASGATLTTNSTTGAVLYLLCQGTFTLDGSINVSGIVNRGNNTWSVTIDGDTFNSPGVANGGAGSGDGLGSSGGSQGSGFGGGGGGSGGIKVHVSNSTATGGSGGSGTSTPSAGAGTYQARTTNGVTDTNGGNGSGSGGGGGIVSLYLNMDQASSIAAVSGAGGATHGASGQTGGGSVNLHGAGSYGWIAGGGGGAGGEAGRAGVHVVIKAKVLVINGAIITSGTAGGNGGAGARSYNQVGARSYWAGGGGGGGGGKGGNVTLRYHTSLTNSGTITRSGGAAGSGGSGGVGNGSTGGAGTAGTSGSLTTTQLADAVTGSISGTLLLSGGPTPKTKHFVSISGALGFTESLNVSKVVAPVEGKDFVYRVYDSDNNYIGVWGDVADDLEFTKRINTPGTTTTVKLARSASTTKEVREVLTDQAADALTTEDSIELVSVSQTPNTIGEDTDVDLNYNVDIYAHYGSFEDLETQDGELIVTEDNENILVAVGYPLGYRVFSGFILDYEATYGDSDYVYVTLASHGYELSHEVIKSGSNTTATYSTTSPEAIVKSILDTNPGTITYNAESIDATGLSISQTFRLNTKLEGIETVYNQTDAGWYWFVDPGDNSLYLKETAATADHTFIFEKHILGISLKRSMESLTNLVYFVGGEATPGDESTTVYKKYADATSISTWRQGLHRITDRRYTVAASMQRRAENQINTYKDPIYTTVVDISSEVYDIETIKLGQVIGFANFGNFVDDVLLQVVSIEYTPYKVSLQLGGLLERQADIIDAVEQSINNEQFMYIPNAPS